MANIDLDKILQETKDLKTQVRCAASGYIGGRANQSRPRYTLEELGTAHSQLVDNLNNAIPEFARKYIALYTQIQSIQANQAQYSADMIAVKNVLAAYQSLAAVMAQATLAIAGRLDDGSVSAPGSLTRPINYHRVMQQLP